MASVWLRVHYIAGRCAYRSGMPRGYNPHPAQSDARREWRRGWTETQATQRIEQTIQDPRFSTNIERGNLHDARPRVRP